MKRAVERLITGMAVAAGLYAVVLMHGAGHTLLALTMLVMVAVGAWTYTSPRTHAARYLFPGIAAALVFVVFPMVYTVSIGFTNYSSAHLLEFERAREVLLEERVPQGEPPRPFHLERVGRDQIRIRLAATADGPEQVTAPQALNEWVVDEADRKALRPHSLVWPLMAAEPHKAQAPKDSNVADASGVQALSMRERVALLPALRRLSLTDPADSADSASKGLSYTLSSLREFTKTRALYRSEPDGSLTDQVSGVRYRPDDREGFFVSEAGERLQPGYRVNVGWAHYARMFTEDKFRAPFLSVFVWTVVFSALTVVGAGALGMLLAVLLNWESLRGRGIYRVVLFLPYAVPGFISILVFKGLFNQNLGEVNFILNGLLGIRPAWFSDPLLAKVMLLIVNVWLGFPYMMVLCSGLIKSIPSDLYEASAVVGAGPFTNFWRITLPLILKPLTPLLISAFAFNFNNFVLISLLTGGRPDQLDTPLPAGTTDILVSYTWRIAFQDSGQQLGLAAAISTVIFLIVAAITLVQMRFTRVALQETRH